MILITGWTGYLGLYVVKHMPSTERLVLNTDDLTQPIRPIDGVTKILHLAAKVPKRQQDYQDVEAPKATLQMMCQLLLAYQCPIVLASSHVAAEPDSSLYAKAKCFSEIMVKSAGPNCVIRLPGLFGLPRRSGTIYEAALHGDVRDSYGPYPAMHVEDAAKAFVEMALAFKGEGYEQYAAQYPDSMALKRRVQQFSEELRVVA